MSATYHTTLSPEQLEAARQRGDVEKITEVPASQGELIRFAEAVQTETVMNNRENPHNARPVGSIRDIVEATVAEIEAGNVPVEIDCQPEVLDIIKQQ